MTYITVKSIHRKALDGVFHIPKGTICNSGCGFILSPDGRTICKETSEMSYEYFRPNTDEGRRREIMLNGLYAYYEQGKGNAWEELVSKDYPDGANTYWKHLLRTMPTPKLTAFYMERLGLPNFKEG